MLKCHRDLHEAAELISCAADILNEYLDSPESKLWRSAAEARKLADVIDARLAAMLEHFNAAP